MSDVDGSNGIAIRWFIAYKFANSLFLGLSIGTVFVIYNPIPPSVFSAGGIGLALGTLLVATQYHRWFNLQWFWRISLLVEVLILAGVLGVLTQKISLAMALFVYLGYQVTFAFGNYLVRCETRLIADDRRLTQLDVAKQSGYLAGMALSWVFYTVLEQLTGVTERDAQVVAIHWPLLSVELLIIALLWRALRGRAVAAAN